MKTFFPFLLSYFLVYVTAEDTRNTTAIVQILGQDIIKGIQTITHPFVEVIADEGSLQCEKLKEDLGVTYEKLREHSELIHQYLKLHYKTSTSTTIINITEAAAETLHQARSFDPDDKLIIFVHGFTDNPTQESFTEIYRSFIDKGHFGVVAVDGSSLISFLYVRSTTFVRFIGQKLGEILATMVYQGQDPSKIHIIGHSLGAHISGFAGKSFHNLTGKLIGRISGLDPAGPCFSNIDPNLRLKHTDAAFVDVIHTNAGVYGIRDAIGHADYFPNGGALQPNCLPNTCSHSRAWQFYGESVLNRDAFPAVRCSDWEAFKTGSCENDYSFMGYAAKPEARGKYFLQTNGESPYGLSLQGLSFMDTPGILRGIVNFLG